ncbi:MAG: glycosyltransferase family 39 protein [bacterium]|nr:glycosyltransferase family 39 protein [bacterium]
MLSVLWQFLNQYTPLFYLTQPIWRDEAFSILVAQTNPQEIIRATSADFTPPLFYLILHYWMLLFGTSEVVTRLLSLVFHIGTIATVYLLTKALCRELKLKNQQLPLYASILTLLNPMLLYYGFEVRAYSLLTLFVTLSFYALVTRRNYLYIISASLGLYTHYYFALAYLSQIIYLVFTNSSIKDLKKKLYVAIPVIIFSPWIPYLINQIISSSESWYYPVTLTVWTTSLGRLFTNYQGTHKGADISLTIYTFCIVWFGVFIARHKNKLGKLLALWLFLPTLIVLFVSGFKPIWVNRYLIYVAVPEILVIIIIISYLSKKMHFTVFTIILIISILINQIGVHYQRKFDFRTPINNLKIQLKPEDLIAVTDSLALFETRYYLKNQPNEIKLFLPPNTHLPSYVGTAIIDKKDIIYTLPTNNTVYLLNLDGSIILKPKQ